MAQQITVHLIDDLTANGTDVHPFRFSIGNRDYVIDLNSANRDQFTALLSRYVKAGRRDVRKRKPYKSASRTDAARIREWAAQTGYVVAARGRLNQSVIDAYDGRNADAVIYAPAKVTDGRYSLEPGRKPGYSENIRRWARDHGVEVSRSGMLPKTVVEAWRSSQYAA